MAYCGRLFDAFDGANSMLGVHRVFDAFDGANSMLGVRRVEPGQAGEGGRRDDLHHAPRAADGVRRVRRNDGPDQGHAALGGRQEEGISRSGRHASRTRPSSSS